MIDERDVHGNTALLLATKKAAVDEDYLKCVDFLFKKGANGKIRDKNGWSALDEAVSQQNTRLVAKVFD
jgi:ankyrin repeat protein